MEAESPEQRALPQARHESVAAMLAGAAGLASPRSPPTHRPRIAAIDPSVARPGQHAQAHGAPAPGAAPTPYSRAAVQRVTPGSGAPPSQAGSSPPTYDPSVRSGRASAGSSFGAAGGGATQSAAPSATQTGKPRDPTSSEMPRVPPHPTQTPTANGPQPSHNHSQSRSPSPPSQPNPLSQLQQWLEPSAASDGNALLADLASRRPSVASDGYVRAGAPSLCPVQLTRPPLGISLRSLIHTLHSLSPAAVVPGAAGAWKVTSRSSSRISSSWLSRRAPQGTEASVAPTMASAAAL